MAETEKVNAFRCPTSDSHLHAAWEDMINCLECNPPEECEGYKCLECGEVYEDEDDAKDCCGEEEK